MSSYLSWLRIPVFATSGLAALGSSLLYFKQNDIIYPASLPAGSRTQVPAPEQFNIQNADSIKFPTPDGETLHAYLLRPPTPSLRRNITLITFHGNAGNVGHRLPIGKVLAESLGCHVFMVEYRGYGLSTGAPSEDGLSIDGQTALDYVRNHEELRKTNIVLYGQSLGGAVAVKLISTNYQVGDIAAVILENTFLSIRKLIPSVMPPAKYISYLCHQRWDSEQSISKVGTKDIPVLFLSGRRDEIVPPFMMTELYQACPTKKVWKEFPNGDHNSTVAEPGYFEAIWQFLAQELMNDPREKNLEKRPVDVDPEKLRSEPIG
jgi:abhydrolase domain-containing protein 13